MTRSLLLAALLAVPAAAEPPRILFIGDSHSVGPFGQELDRLLRETGASVLTRAVCASAPRSWVAGTRHHCGFFYRDADGATRRGTKEASTPPLAGLLSQHNAAWTVVQLGGNLHGGAPATVKAQVGDLARRVAEAGSKCLWVGPPNRRDNGGGFDAWYAAIKEGADPYCVFLDSRPVTPYPPMGGDGIHYGGPAGTATAKAWAAAAERRMRGGP